MEIKWSEHGFHNKLERKVPTSVIKDSIKKAKLPKGNYPVYIYNRQHKFYIVCMKNKGILKVITIVINAINGMNINKRNALIRIV